MCTSLGLILRAGEAKRYAESSPGQSASALVLLLPGLGIEPRASYLLSKLSTTKLCL